jgi:hypothetical protein
MEVKMILNKKDLHEIKEDFINLSNKELLKKYKKVIKSIETIKNTLKRNYAAHYEEIMTLRAVNSKKRRRRPFANLQECLKKDK